MTYNKEKQKQKPKQHNKTVAKTTEAVAIVSLYEIRTDLALLKQKLDHLMGNDLKHITNDINLLKRFGLGFFMAVLLSVLTLHLDKLF